MMVELYHYIDDSSIDIRIVEQPKFEYIKGAKILCIPENYNLDESIYSELLLYNAFIKLNNRVKDAFSTMDVYLKKRWDLVPNLIEIIKGYTKYESNVLKDIIDRAWRDLVNKKDVSKYGFIARFQVGLCKILPHRLIIVMESSESEDELDAVTW